MRIVMFYHSIVSDWNHGNAHFLRGIVTELLKRGHEVTVFEPRNGWSFSNLMREKGESVVRQFKKVYPQLKGVPYELERLDLDEMLAGADLVVVHEWSEHELVRRVGAHRKKKGGYRLLFHDTHHRSVTDSAAMHAYDLTGFDGVLAYGRKIRDIYLAKGWADRVWLWHEAADVRVFHPLDTVAKVGDVVWIGNWGDDERSEEIREFFVEPVKRLRLKGMVYGVRYPSQAPGAGRNRVWRLVAQLRGSKGIQQVPAHSPHPAAPLRQGVARHPHHPPVRGPCLRDSPFVGALG